MSSSNGNGRPSSYAPRDNHGAQSKIACEPGPKDEQEGEWPRSKLLRMDLPFRRAMERAVKRGLERPPDGAAPEQAA